MRYCMAWIVTFVSLGVPSLAGAAFTPFVVENSGGSQVWPAVSGSFVFWSEIANGGFFVRGKNIATGQVFSIDGPGWEFGPSTNGSIVVWGDNRAGNGDVYAMDLQTGYQWALVDGPYNQSGVVGENYVVWGDDRYTPPKAPPEDRVIVLYAMDLRTGQQFEVGRGGGADVSGDVIVWSNARSAYLPSGEEVYGYNVETGKQFLIASDPTYRPQELPAVSGNTVVWVDLHNGGDIMGYNISTAMAFPIHVDPEDSPADQLYPDIDGRYVVWLDGRNVDGVFAWTIMGYDLVSAQEFRIADAGFQVEPKISGNLVVWNTPFDPGAPSRIMAAYIPEPASAGLLGLGAALLAGRRGGR